MRNGILFLARVIRGCNGAEGRERLNCGVEDFECRIYAKKKKKNKSMAMRCIDIAYLPKVMSWLDFPWFGYVATVALMQ